MKATRALVVDQDPQVREIVSGYLRERGYTVHAVASRTEGFDAIDDLAPDVLFLDDPAHLRAYRLVWLREQARDDLRVELLDLDPACIRQQLEAALPA